MTLNVTQSLVYRTGGGTGDGMDPLTDAGCADGVRTRTLGGDTIRSMMTASGLFVLDMPAGQGGLISFKTSKAAALADFAGKAFGGIVFPDIGLVEPLKADFGAMGANEVSFTSTVGTNPPEMLNIRSVAAAPVAAVPGPDYPDFTATPTGYLNNVLSGTYANPGAIPGLFRLDGLNDSGTSNPGGNEFQRQGGCGRVWFITLEMQLISTQVREWLLAWMDSITPETFCCLKNNQACKS